MGRKLALVAFSAGVVMSCGDDGPTGPVAASIVVNFEIVSLQQLDSVRLIPSIVDGKGQLITGVVATFASSDPAIVMVSGVGVITAVGPSGSATVTVKSGKLTHAVAVNVTQVATRLTVTPNPAVVAQKATLQLDAKLLDRTNVPIAGSPITYASSNVAVATVSVTGLVTGVGPASTVVLTVQSGAFIVTIPLAVTQTASKLVVTPSTAKFGTGRSLSLAATVLDAVDAPIPNFPVTYESLAPALVSVSAAGVVSSIGPLGTAAIRVTAVGTTLTQDVSLTIVSVTSPTGESTQLIPAQLMYAVRAFASDSAIGVSYNGDASVVNLNTSTVRPFGIASAYGVGISNSRKRVYFASGDGNVYEVNLAANTQRTLSLGGQLFDLVVDPQERYAYVGVPGTAEVAVIDLSLWQVVTRIPVGNSALHLTMSADGSKLYVGGGDVAEIDIAHGNAVRILSGLGAQATAVSSNGQYLFAFSEGSQVARFDLTNSVVVNVWPLQGCPAWGAAMSPDDRILLVSCPGAATVVILDPTNGNILKRFSVAEGRRVAFTADGAIGLVGSANGLFVVR